MFETFAEFFEALWQGELTPLMILEWVFGVFASGITIDGVSQIHSALIGFVDPVYGLLPYIFIFLSLIVAFFGKKILGILKFLAIFVTGFIFGAYFITPVFADLISVPSWVWGLVIGIVAAVLYRFVYYTLYGVSMVYIVYVLCYTGFTLSPLAENSSSRAVICLGIALVVALILYVLMRYIEMMGTAILGGYLVYLTVDLMLVDFDSLEFISAAPWVAPLVIIFVVALPGFMVQFKTRKRY